MEIIVKKFYELSLDELYEIVKAREVVFHMEQKVTEIDYDDVDKISYHMFALENDKLIGYIRIYNDENNIDIVHLGRFLTIVRRKGYGRKIFKEAVDYSINKLHAKRIEIHAQTYVKDLYKEFGFNEEGEPFYEAGIEHIKMTLNQN